MVVGLLVWWLAVARVVVDSLVQWLAVACRFFGGGSPVAWVVICVVCEFSGGYGGL